VLALGSGRFNLTQGLLNVTPAARNEVDFSAASVVTLGVGVPEEDLVGKQDGWL